MDFYVDLAVAVLLRLLKDKRQRGKYLPALRKIYNTIGNALVVNHVDWNSDDPERHD